MKKRNLLAMALASLALSSASATSFDLIKDGKFVDGVKFCKTASTDVLEENEVDGVGPVVTYTRGEKDYQQVNIYSENALNLNQNWIWEIEYYYENGNIPESYLSPKWSAITLGIGRDTSYIKQVSVKGVVKDSTFNFVPEITTPIDGKFDKQVFQGNADRINKDSAFIFSRQDMEVSKEAKFFSIAFCNQAGGESNIGVQLHIKNLRIVSDGIKPFYAENFSYSGLDAWVDAAMVEKYYLNKEDLSFSELNTETTAQANTKWNGSLALAVDKVKFDETCQAVLLRLWEDNGTDASGIYYDSELLHGLNIQKGNVNSTYIWNIPVENLTAKGDCKISVKFLGKWQASATEEGMTENTEADLRELPIFAIFDNNLSSATAVVEGALIEGQWTAYNSEITIPANTKTLTIQFKSNPNFSYCIDNFFLAPTEDTLLVFDAYDKDPYDAKDSRPSKIGVHVASIASNDANASAYFDGDNFIVKADEEIASISIIDMAGKTASVNGGEFNVSGFNKGIYVFVAKTVNGVSISGKIIIE